MKNAMTGREATKIDCGHCLIELDEAVGLWCVFGENSGFAYASAGSLEEANEKGWDRS